VTRVNEDAAGVDIGAIEIVACVAGDENTQIVLVCIDKGKLLISLWLLLRDAVDIAAAEQNLAGGDADDPAV
jgi:hypothetical protein